MSSFMQKMKQWFARQEGRSMQADQRHQEFDDMTDRVADHKDHMLDRIEGSGDD
ncbi:MAG: hypothetical protein ACR2QO_04530 [Acidimicrobiales bacterium]